MTANKKILKVRFIDDASSECSFLIVSRSKFDKIL